MKYCNILLIGAPGSGKGTQASIISTKFELANISTGEMFRDAIRKQTQLGTQAKKYMDAGKLVPDEVVIGMVEERLTADDCNNGFILDGFPRTITQADELAKKVKIDLVLEIKCNDEQIIKRLSGRRVHPGSGRIYHVETNPPKQEGIDDLTGEALEHRIDDQPETIKKRLEVFQEKTAPLINYYQKEMSNAPNFISVDGSLTINEITNQILAILDN